MKLFFDQYCPITVAIVSTGLFNGDYVALTESIIESQQNKEEDNKSSSNGFLSTKGLKNED